MSGRGSGRRAAPCVAALCALLASPAFGQAPASPPPPTDPAELDPSAPLAPLPDLEVGWPDLNAKDEVPAVAASPAEPSATAEVGDHAYAVSYTHLRAHETPEHLVCRLLLEKTKAS